MTGWLHTFSSLGHRHWVLFQDVSVLVEKLGCILTPVLGFDEQLEPTVLVPLHHLASLNNLSVYSFPRLRLP